MRKIRITAALAALTTTLAVFTGCGGDEPKTSAISAPSFSQSSKASSSESKTESSSESRTESSSESRTESSSQSSVESTAESADESGIESSSESVTESGEESSAESSAAAYVPDPDTAVMSGTVLVLGNGRGLALFYGTSSQAETYASNLNKFKRLVGDINVYTLTAPTACSFYCPEKYKKSYGLSSEKDFTAHIKSCLEGVVSVDAYSNLEKHTDEHIYFATDHHWTPLGAYYAGEAFAKTAGVPFADMSGFDAVSKDGYIGTLYNYSNNHYLIGNNPENFTYYKPKANYTATDYSYGDVSLTGGYESDIITPSNYWYLVFGMDNIIRRVRTDAGTGRRLMIIKDSYANAAVPSLVSSFDEIYVTDMRYFGGSIVKFAKANGVTDVLFLMDSFSAATCNGYLSAIIY